MARPWFVARDHSGRLSFRRVKEHRQSKWHTSTYVCLEPQAFFLKTQDSGLKTQDSGLRTQDSGLKTQDSRLRTQDSTMLPFCIIWRAQSFSQALSLFLNLAN